MLDPVNVKNFIFWQRSCLVNLLLYIFARNLNFSIWILFLRYWWNVKVFELNHIVGRFFLVRWWFTRAKAHSASSKRTVNLLWCWTWHCFSFLKIWESCFGSSLRRFLSWGVFIKQSIFKFLPIDTSWF